MKATQAFFDDSMIQHDPSLQDQPWKPLKALLSELGKDYKSAIGQLQYFGCVDQDMRWSSAILHKGYVQPVSYVATYVEFGIGERITMDLVSPHGELFFRKFF